MPRQAKKRVKRSDEEGDVEEGCVAHKTRKLADEVVQEAE